MIDLLPKVVLQWITLVVVVICWLCLSASLILYVFSILFSEVKSSGPTYSNQDRVFLNALINKHTN